MTTAVLSLAAAVNALNIGSLRAVSVVRAPAPIMMPWNPMTDASNDAPLPPPPSSNAPRSPGEWVPPPPEYAPPEDGCEIVRPARHSLQRHTHWLPLPAPHSTRCTGYLVQLYGAASDAARVACWQVTLDQYASTVFGRSAAQQEAWICAEHDLKDAQERGEECKLVMHKGELIWACVMDQGETPVGNWQKAGL
tara:strand:- start:21 stop:602 length:582 start_codon:yes stop_codon:yes gene_type:complete